MSDGLIFLPFDKTIISFFLPIINRESPSNFPRSPVWNQPSLSIASEYGYDCKDLNSEILASLLASQNAREEFSELQNKIEDFFEEIKNELEELEEDE